MASSTDRLEIVSPAKINLGLIIKGKREDGYHLLETLMMPVGLADEMRFSRREEAGISISMGDSVADLKEEDNLIYKAWQLLNADHPEVTGINIDVVKNIPAGAGLGGGSSNAGNTLRALDEMFELGLGAAGLLDYAKKLGADVPFFLTDVPMIASGIGQDLEPFELPFEFDIRMELPGIHSSTAEAYNGLDLSKCDPNRDLREILALPFEDWKENLVNDLEKPVFARHPELKLIKESFYQHGAGYAAMSGSGSSLFGLVKRVD